MSTPEDLPAASGLTQAFGFAAPRQAFVHAGRYRLHA
jgi:hypothetical protein